MWQCHHQSQKEHGGLLAIPRSTAGGCSSPPGASSSPPAPSQHPSQRRCWCCCCPLLDRRGSRLDAHDKSSPLDPFSVFPRPIFFSDLPDQRAQTRAKEKPFDRGVSPMWFKANNVGVVCVCVCLLLIAGEWRRKGQSSDMKRASRLWAAAPSPHLYERPLDRHRHFCQRGFHGGSIAPFFRQCWNRFPLGSRYLKIR